MKSFQEWLVAIQALTDPPKGKKGDPKPLAKLLRGRDAPPRKTLYLLAELIAPELPTFNVKLVVQAKRNGSWAKYINGKKRQITVCAHVWWHKNKLKESISDAQKAVAEEFRLSEATVAKDWQTGKKLWSIALDAASRRAQTSGKNRAE